MVNLYKVKVYAAFIISPLIAVISFVVGAQFFGFMFGLCFMAVGILIAVLISKLLTKNAFSDMLEGKGVLALNIDSTGIVRPFVVRVESPYIRNVKQGVDDVFDRSAVMQLATPENNRVALTPLPDGGVRLVLDKKAMMKLKEIKADGFLELEKGSYKVLAEDKKKIRLALDPDQLEKLKEKTRENITVLEIDEDTYNKGRFALFHYPCLIYNDQTRSIITKDFLAEGEKEAFAEHGILYLNRKMQELTSIVRDFGRYVVELTKPQGGFLQSKWVWVIVIIAFVILAAMFAPAIINAIKGISSNAGDAFTTSVGAATQSGSSITPR